MSSNNITLTEFSGGLNLRDSPNEIETNETPDALNFTLDQRGGLSGRHGWFDPSTGAVALPGTSGKLAILFYSAALDQWLCARESAATIHLWTHATDLSAGVWTDRGTINSSVLALSAFCDFPGATPKVVIATDVNSGATKGIWTWDGTNLVNVSTTVAGNAICLWQNRAWVSGYPTSDANGNPTRLSGCKVADPATWAPPDGLTVDIRDKDALRLTGLGVAAGALIVFKARSAHRINNSADGANVTIDPAAGAVGPLAVVPLRGRLYTWGADSLYEFDGYGAGLRAGDKCRPLFQMDATTWTTVGQIAGGVLEDRVVFAYPSVAANNNDRYLEFDPEHGWLMKHQLALSEQISSFSVKNSLTWAALRNTNATVGSALGTAVGMSKDNGTSQITAYARTPWLQPAGGKLARIVRAQLEAIISYNGATAGTSTLVLRVYKDWDLTVFDDYDVSATVANNIVLGTQVTQLMAAIIRALGHARAFAFEFRATQVGNPVPVIQIGGLALDPIGLER